MVARALWRLAFQSVTVVSLVIGASLLMVAMAAVCLRPEAFAAGFARVGWGLGAFLGTVAAGTVPLLAFFSASLCAARLTSRGETMALSSLGYGPLSIWRGLWPLWMFLSILALVFAFLLEPPSWRAIHLLKGSPQAAAVAWARLEAGELRVLPGGGGLVLDGGSLRFASAAGSWRGSFTVPSRARATEGDGWELGPSTITRKDGSTWAVERIKLRPNSRNQALYLEAPSSPWARDSFSLLKRPCAEDAFAECDRTALVLHRRMSWIPLVPIMALLGWLLAWTPARSGRGGVVSGAATVLPVLGLYSLLKLSELGLGAGLLSGAVAAWLPLLVAACFTVWVLFGYGAIRR